METTENVLHQHGEQHGASWEGATSPFNVSYGKLMMWYFLLSDAFTFAGFLIAYGALRFSSPSWPVPDFVFSTAPFDIHHAPLIFVTFMSFLLIISSVTMVRAVQEGQRENKRGVVFWMLLTIIGGAGFLSCQAWEWSNLIGKEHMSVTTNPFGSHVQSGVYLDEKGNPSSETFVAGASYLMHKSEEGNHDGAHASDHHALAKGDHPHAFVDEDGFIHRKFEVTSGPNKGVVEMEEFGPKAFGALFFFITGFHGFHVLSGVAFLLIITINVASGVYAARKNGYEMVEKIGLYWHFVDLVWVFVFLVFYLF
jgi:cytochrome c oxidase subunit 3